MSAQLVPALLGAMLADTGFGHAVTATAIWGDMTDDFLPTPSSVHPFRCPRRVTGVVILSASLQPLYMNQLAQDICEHLWSEEGTAVKRSVLPQVLLHCSREVLKVLEVRLEALNWERFMTEHVSVPSKRQFLIRGLGLPHRNGLTHSRILLYIEERVDSQLAASDRLWYRFLLDGRDSTSPAPENSHGAQGTGSES